MLYFTLYVYLYALIIQYQHNHCRFGFLFFIVFSLKRPRPFYKLKDLRAFKKSSVDRIYKCLLTKWCCHRSYCFVHIYIMEIRIKITFFLSQLYTFSIAMECLYRAPSFKPFAQITFSAKYRVLWNGISCQQKPCFKKLFLVFNRLQESVIQPGLCSWII